MRQFGRISLTVLVVSMSCAAAARGEQYELITGVDEDLSPGSARFLVTPGPGVPPFFDGDRLGGTADVGPPTMYQGTGTPLFNPNEFGSLSFIFRRGSIPCGFDCRIPLMGIDFLGGPLLDLDGDLLNGSRSLIPVIEDSEVVDPAAIPDTTSVIDLGIDVDAGEITLQGLDATGSSEGGPGIEAAVATTLNLLAGTQLDGSNTGSINPSIDTRTGTLSSLGGTPGVYEISDLGFEFWQDTLSANSATANVLGTLQTFGMFSGWLVQRDPETGLFVTLSGKGLGTTGWPAVDTSQIGSTLNTANGLFGGSATIAAGIPASGGPGLVDDFTADAGETPTGEDNGGEALSDFGGDIGGYFDSVVVPEVPCGSSGFVYLESAGFGINNSSDPVFVDSVGYDVVIVAAAAPSALAGDFNGDGVLTLVDYGQMADCYTGPGPGVLEDCCGVFDVDGDTDIDLADFADFQANFTGE